MASCYITDRLKVFYPYKNDDEINSTDWTNPHIKIKFDTIDSQSNNSHDFSTKIRLEILGKSTEWKLLLDSMINKIDYMLKLHGKNIVYRIFHKNGLLTIKMSTPSSDITYSTSVLPLTENNIKLVEKIVQFVKTIEENIQYGDRFII